MPSSARPGEREADGDHPIAVVGTVPEHARAAGRRARRARASRGWPRRMTPRSSVSRRRRAAQRRRMPRAAEACATRTPASRPTSRCSNAARAQRPRRRDERDPRRDEQHASAGSGARVGEQWRRFRTWRSMTLACLQGLLQVCRPGAMKATPIPRTLRFWVAAPGRGEIRVDALAEPRARRSAGPRAILRHQPWHRGARVERRRAAEREYVRMRAPFQAGDFPAPVKYGYSSVGVVEARSARSARPQRVLPVPHQTRYVVPAAAVHGAARARAAGARGAGRESRDRAERVWDAAPRVGDRVAVVGAGTVGAWCAWLAARVRGCDVQLVDVDARKAAIAGRLGVAFARPAGGGARRGRRRCTRAGRRPGSRPRSSSRASRRRSSSSAGTASRRPALPLGEAFHSRRLALKSSQVGTIAAAQRSRWTRGAAHAARARAARRARGSTR